MIAYIIRRIIYGAAVLLGTSIITFTIAFVIPADPAVAMAGAKADPQTLATIRHQLGLDQPVYVQYAHYLDRALHGDLGRSYIRRASVTQLILSRFPATAILALCAMALSLALGIPMGMVAAAWRGRAVDNTLLVVSLALISVPVFWLGTMLLIAGGLYLHSFPLGGFDGLKSLVLPTIALALGSAGYYSRILHTNLVEALEQDYIRTARGKGLSAAQALIAPRDGQRDAAAGDAGGARSRGTALRRGADRDRVQLAGNRAARLRGGIQSRHPAHHGHGAVLGLPGRRRQPAGGPALRLARSANPAE